MKGLNRKSNKSCLHLQAKLLRFHRMFFISYYEDKGNVDDMMNEKGQLGQTFKTREIQ